MHVCLHAKIFVHFPSLTLCVEHKYEYYYIGALTDGNLLGKCCHILKILSMSIIQNENDRHNRIMQKKKLVDLLCYGLQSSSHASLMA